MFLRKVIDGYKMDEVVSSLQKAIRRSDSTGALYWARLMYRHGFGNGCYNRLKIITSEDSAANLWLPIVVHEQWLQFKKALGSKRKLTESKDIPACLVPLERAVLACARSPKSRCLNHWLGITRKQLLDHGEPKPLEDILQGLGKALHAKQPDTALEYGLRLLLGGHQAELWPLLQQFARTNKDELRCLKALKAFAKQNENLALGHSIAMLLRSAMPVPFLFQPIAADIPIPPPLSERLDIPEFALDKHTGRGKAMGRGIEHFLTVGALVHDELFADPWFEAMKVWYLAREKEGRKPKSAQVAAEIKEKWGIAKPKKRERSSIGTKGTEPMTKRVKIRLTPLTRNQKGFLKRRLSPSTRNPKGFPKKEGSSRFPKILPPPCEFVEVATDPLADLVHVLYTQMPTGQKCPAVVGLDPISQKRVFLKGPDSKDHVETAIYLNEIKKNLVCLEHLPMEALVYHNPLTCKKQYYLRTVDLSDPARHVKPKIVHWNVGQKDIHVLGSTQQPQSLIFKEYLEEFKEQFSMIPREMIQKYLAILLWRSVFGISDSNNRNVMVVRRPNDPIKIYSVDESNMGHPMPSAKWLYSCSNKWKEQILRFMVEEKEWLLKLLDEWNAFIPGTFQANLVNVRGEIAQMMLA